MDAARYFDNYRINVFGLMAIPELTKDDGRCGNYIYYRNALSYLSMAVPIHCIS